MRLHPITSIDELLKHDVAYGHCLPVLLFNRKSSRSAKLAKLLLALVIVCAAATLLGRLWSYRAYIAYPSNYLTRLVWLNGARANLTEMDCANFIANAYGSELTFVFWKTHTTVVETFPTAAAVDESILQPGDVANFDGQHVAAFLGHGVWIDADYRRGDISKFLLSEKPATDPWFQGPVTIKRFNERVR